MKLWTLAFAILFISIASAATLPANTDAWTDNTTNWTTTSGSIILNTLDKVAGVGSIEFQFLPLTYHDYNFDGQQDISNYDTFHIWTKRQAKNANVQWIRFYTDPSNYYQYDIGSSIYFNPWTEILFLKNDFNATGSPDWSNISNFSIYQQGTAPFARVYIDKMHWSNPDSNMVIGYGGSESILFNGYQLIIPAFTDDYQHIVGKVDVINDAINYRVSISDQDKLCFQYSVNNTIYAECSTATLLNDTQYRFGMTTNETQLYIYINGSLDSNHSILTQPLDTNSEPLTLGKTPDGTGGFVGVIDNIRIYDKPLNASQIASELSAAYAQEEPRFTYDFDIGSFSTAFDTHLQKWNTDRSIVMTDGSYDDSIQCVTYDAPGPTYFESGIIRLILDNLLVFAALGILTMIAAWIVINQ